MDERFSFCLVVMKHLLLKEYVFLVLFCSAAYFPLFLHLDWEPVHNWDESLFAMRAGYMAEEGKYLPNYSFWVENGPLHQNTKPPFTTWIQALSMKVFGISELALRLPIALSALALVLLFLIFSKRQTGSYALGYCAGFVLITTHGFIREHAARTGDQDAALAFYMLAGAFAFFKYIGAATNQERHKWLALLTFLLVISALTKYIFGLFFLVAFFFYAIYKGELFNIVNRGSTWLAIAIFFVAVGSWFVVMEVGSPGFAERAFFYEMLDRYTTVIEKHKAPWYYYFENLWSSLFRPWLLLVPVALGMVFSKKFRALRDILVLMLLCAVCLLVIISFSQTKLPHYDVVAYPPLAFVAGAGLYGLVDFIAALYRKRSHFRVAAILLGAGFFYFLAVAPYQSILEAVYMPKLVATDLKYGYLLKNAEKTQPDVKSFKLLQSGFDGQAIYYAGLLNRKKDYDIQLSMNPEQVKIGEWVATCDQHSINYLLEKFELKPVETYEQCFLAQVTGLKGRGKKSGAYQSSH